MPPPFGQKTPLIAGILSFFPGLGNIYNGLYLRGATFFLAVATLFALGNTLADRHETELEMAFLIPSIFFLYLFNIFDAYRQANLINYWRATGQTLPEQPPLGQRLPFSGTLLPGIMLFSVGLYALLRKYFDIELTWLFQHWPIAITALGGWMIFRALQDRKRERLLEAEEGLG